MGSPKKIAQVLLCKKEPVTELARFDDQQPRNFSPEDLFPTPYEDAPYAHLSTPGYIETQQSKFSHRKPLHRLAEIYREAASELLYLRNPNGGVDILTPYKPGVIGTAETLHQWASAPRQDQKEPLWDAGRGFTAQLIVKDVLHAMTREFDPAGSICIRPAPPQLDGNNHEDNRGGDLLVLKNHGDGTTTALCLIDVKLAASQRLGEDGRIRRPKRKLKSGMNCQLSYPIPTIVVFVGDIPFRDVAGIQYALNDYVAGKVHELVTLDDYYGVLPYADMQFFEQFVLSVRQRVHDACKATKKRIDETAQGRYIRDKMLYQLALTDKVIGTRN